MNDVKVIEVVGRAVPVIGDDIDNDRIIPARYLKEITFNKMGEYPFIDERFNADGSKKNHPFNDPGFQGASILLANANFGCGSSREHAPQSLFRWGIKAIVAESFGEIFAGNCVMLGVPAVVARKEDVARLQVVAGQNPQTEFAIDLECMVVNAGNLSVPVTMSPSYRKTLIDGTWDLTSILLSNAGRVEETAKRLNKIFA